LHENRTTCKIIAFLYSNFSFLDSQEDYRFCTAWWQALPGFNVISISSWIKLWLLLSFRNIWTVTHLQMIWLLFLCPDFDLHSGAR
jgi:hypothetical protein